MRHPTLSRGPHSVGEGPRLHRKEKANWTGPSCLWIQRERLPPPAPAAMTSHHNGSYPLQLPPLSCFRSPNQKRNTAVKTVHYFSRGHMHSSRAKASESFEGIWRCLTVCDPRDSNQWTTLGTDPPAPSLPLPFAVEAWPLDQVGPVCD